MTVANLGPSDAQTVTLVDVLPVEVVFVSATPDQGSCGESAGTVTCALGTITSGASVDVVIVVIVPSSASAGTVTNNATVTTTTADPEAANDATSEDTTITTSADVSVVKVDSADPVTAGTGFSYTVTVANTGPSDAASVSMVDVLPVEVGFVSATPDQGSCSEAAGTVTCALATIVDGASVDVVIVVTVPSGTAAGTITNNATVTTSTSDPVAGNDATSEDTTISSSADVSVVKVDSADPVTAGTGFSYTVTVANLGPSDAAAVSLVDVLPVEVGFVSATPDQGSCTEVAGTVTCALGTMVDGASVDVVIVVTVPSGTAAGTITNNATVTTGTSDPAAGNDATSEDTTITISADLAVSKVDSVDPVVAGTGFSYTVTVTNTGPSDAASVTLLDVLPVEVSFVSATPDQGSCSEAAGTVTCALGTIVDGASVDVVIVVTVPSGTAAGTVTNNATVTTTTADPVAANDATSEDTSITTSADVSVVKADSADPITAGTGFSYTVTVTNTGPSDAASVSLVDVLPVEVSYVSATPDQGSCSEAAGTVTCALGTIVDGASVDVVIVVTVPSDTAAGTITNNATVTTGTSDPVVGNDAASEDTTITASADVSVVKVDSADPVLAGTGFLYTLTVTNTGPSDAQTATLVDVLSAEVAFVSATPDQGSCSEAAGTVTCALGTIVDGASVDVVIVVTVPSDTTAGTVTNNATVTTTTTDPVAANDATSEDTTITVNADLAVTKVDSVDPVTAGTGFSYTVTVVNNGPSDATGVAIVDTLPAGLTYISAIPDQGSCSEAGGTITCALGPMTDGATADIVITVGVPSDAIAGSSYSNTATVSAVTADPVGSNNSDGETTLVVASADLSITKVDSIDPATAGNPLTYTLAVLNSGPSDAVSVTVTDVLPPEVTHVSATPDQGSCLESAGTVTCALGNIVDGGMVAITVVVTVNADVLDGATIANAASVSSPTPDPTPANNSDTESTDVLASADLVVAKSDSVDPAIAGTLLTYTITVTNASPSDAQAVTLTDVLPAGLVFSSAITSQGSCSESGGTVTCSPGTVAAGSVVTIMIAVGVDEDATGVITNSASVTSATTDPVGSNNADSEDTTISVEADLWVTKSSAPGPLVPGDPMTYTIVVGNDGPSAVLGAILTDALPVELLAPTWTCVGAGGGSCTGSGSGDLNEFIDLPVGATVTFGVAGTVDPTTPTTVIITNTATVSVPAGVTDPDPTDNSDTDSNPFASDADVALSKSASPDPVVAGSPLTYTIAVANNGPGTATDVGVTDSLPVDATFVSAAVSGGAGTEICGETGGVVSCALGTIDNAMTETITITVLIDPSALGTLINTAGVTTSSTDPVSTNNDDSATVTATAQSDLALTKSVAPTVAEVGDGLTYTIVVTASGPSDATNVVVNDPVPAGVAIDSASSSQGTCTVASGLTCTIGTMAAGASVTITVNATAEASGTAINTAHVITDAVDSVATNNSDSASVNISGVGSIRSVVWWDLDKDGVVDLGEPRMAGVTVELHDDGGLLIASDVTDSAGAYLFSGLTPGDYEVRVDPTTVPAGASLVSDPDGALDGAAALSVAIGAQSVGIDFGYAGTATLSGVVFHDVDEDDTREPPFEPGLPFVDVRVTWAGPDGVFDTSDDVEYATITDGLGVYEADCVPPGAYRILVDEDSLPAGLEVTSTDHPATRNVGAGGSAFADFGVGGNAPPIAVDDNVTTPRAIPVAIVVLSNDTDPEGDPLVIVSVGSASNGQVSLAGDGSVIYTPQAGFVGVDSFVYTIEDEDGDSDSAVVTITVTGSNAPPEYVGPSEVPVEPGAPLPNPLVLDPDNDDVTIEIITGELPDGVELIDGKFVGIPIEEGEFEITIRVCDDASPPLCTLTTVSYVIEDLPFTGANSLIYLHWAITLLMLGGWLLLFSSRREEQQEA